MSRMPATLAVAVGQYSTAGAKTENQDFHGFLQPQGEALASKGIALAIADGISTSSLGAVAAETAVKSFLTDYYCTSDAWTVRTSAERVIAATNSWMHAQNGRSLDDRERERGMICTLSTIVLKGTRGHIFHVGDARVARASGNSFEPLTSAHRVYIGGGESFLGRALGADHTIEIDYVQVDLEAGDLFMLSTDGVHEYLRDEDARALIGAHPDLDHAAQAIVDAALSAGSPDNLSVQLVRIDQLPDAEVRQLIGLERPLEPAPLLRPGEQFSGFDIVREIHSGSRSHVYLALDCATGRRVALKVPSTEHAGDPAKLQELLFEEWVMRRLDHPNLLKPVTLTGPRSHIFSVTEYLEGRTLSQWIHDNPRPPLEEVRRLVREIGAGLQAMHRREMLHRDLRPQNVLVDTNGTAVIIDFGSVQAAGLEESAPHASSAAVAGTLQYSAPELYLGYAASRQSDIYSLGVIAYQLLTSGLPYAPRLAAAGSRPAQLRFRYAPARELNPQVPAWVDAALAKAVAIDPSNRYHELSEFLFDLTTPNPSLPGVASRPLLDRAPKRVWQAISIALAIALAVSIATRPAEPSGDVSTVSIKSPH